MCIFYDSTLVRVVTNLSVGPAALVAEATAASPARGRRVLAVGTHRTKLILDGKMDLPFFFFSSFLENRSTE